QGAGMDNYQNNEDNIDLLNEDTFGAGAVEEDWELDHNQLVGLHEAIPLLHIQNLKTTKSLHSPLQLDDEELERSNQQLAAAVEELVLNSDQDQDMIDPAIWICYTSIKPIFPKMLVKCLNSTSSLHRGPSPTYGISIPSNNNHDPVDRSLPPRSVSPLFGSPSPSNMPIGTPPKHVIMNMMHHLEQICGPPYHLNVSSQNSGMPIGVPQPRNVVWPNQQPMNPLIAQDIMNRLGMRPPTPQPNHPSPIGSPRAFMVPPPRLMSNPRQMHLPPGGNFESLINFVKICTTRFMHPMPAPQFGPGHLHPEHSKYVRMRQQRYGGHDSMGRSRGGNFFCLEHQYEERIGIPGDPYANIMNQKEKDWVIRIQMMALQSDRPEIDDYYYQNYIERRLREGRLNSDQSKPARLITPTKPNLENRKYVPVQFSNSLGKLTTSSVYNPRQIIDIVQTANQDEAGDAADTRQALSKRLVVYKTIEKAYEIIVLMEELQAQIQLCPPNASARRSLGDHLQSKTRQMLDVLDLHDGMAFDLHDDPIFQVMKIRKGKKLIGRTLHFLPQTHAVTVIQSIFSHFAILIKRDARD
uniref:mRNA decay factor PAT1 domain-containing protein n=1 Tax=Ciona intestinalis TaxID=7719 RepID=H2XSE6_CIOIN